MPELTDKFVSGLKVKSGQKILTVYDQEVKGFGVAILPSGTKTFLYKYRNAEGIERKYKIGRHGVLKVTDARKRAKDIAAKVFLKEDPSEELKSFRQEARDKKAAAKTIKDLCHDYLVLHAAPNKRLKSRKEDERVINSYLIPAFGDSAVTELTYRDIETWRLNMKDKPYQANRILACFSKMYSLAVKWGWCEKNPVIGVTRYPEEKRVRYLDEEELHRLMVVLERHGNYPVANALKLMLLTGARKGEVLNATWGQFNLDKGLWIKPSHMTKQKKTEYVPLLGEALDLIKELQKRAEEEERSSPDSPMFPGRIPGEPLKEIKKFWARVCHEAQLEDAHIHDLRHTYASYLVSAGLSLPTLGKLLGHTQAGTTLRYAHLADAALREGTQIFDDKIKSLKGRRQSEERAANKEEA